MSFDSLVNQGDYLSPHYLAEVLPNDLKKGLLKRWDEEKYSGRVTPQTGIRGLNRAYFEDRAFLDGHAEVYNRVAHSTLGDGDGEGTNGWDSGERRRDHWRKTLHELHGETLRALGFEPRAATLTVRRAGREHQIRVFSADSTPGGGTNGSPHIVAVECGWATNTDAALDPAGAGRLLEPVDLGPSEKPVETGSKLATFLFSCEAPPRYVLLLAGGVLTLADQHHWGEGRFLSVSLDTALSRRDIRPAGELDTIAGLFSADALNPPVEGGTEPLAELVGNSHKHAVGVSAELRDGLKDSVELIANEVLARIREAGVEHDQVILDPRPGEPTDLARALTRESLRYLYRILFLLYAEARPDLGILPSDHPEYGEGYGLARLGNLVWRPLASEEARRGFHMYESLDLLFRMVNQGHRPRGATEERPVEEKEKVSEGEGIRFEPLRSDLFEPDAIRLIGRRLENPLYDEGDPDAAGQPRYLDTRLRNATLRQVLAKLMITPARRKGRRGGMVERGGFISYAQLGISQIGAVYEGLMSYGGFIADEELIEVAKDGDPEQGSWLVPASRIDEYLPLGNVFVERTDEETGKKRLVRHALGSFVYRLAGRDRQTSASYYTPKSLAEVTVQLALQYRMEEADPPPTAQDLLTWKICEPALGSGHFLNEAIDQVAAKYLEMRERELGEPIPAERRDNELRKVKAYLALHNCYGVDLNETAVELAEVSLWLNVMHPGLQAPWFGLHLRRGNSLIGAGRRVYDEDVVRLGDWLTEAPTDVPLRDGDIPEGSIHHFLLPAIGWGAVASEKEAKELAPEEAKQLAAWRRGLRRKPSTKRPRGMKLSQFERLQAVARRAEYLWGLVQKRLEISEREVSRGIEVWGAEDLPQPSEAVSREKVQQDLRDEGTPFWRLKTVMDAWCALWFWPVEKAGLLDGTAPEYQGRDDLTTSMPRSGRRLTIPLKDLGDWIDFAEATLGTADIADQTIAAQFGRLSDLEQHETDLEVWMGMDSPIRLIDRFQWLDTARQIAKEQGFFHWELEFAQVFAKGGFDLQMGNPPWVRPTWDDAAVFAELDPWFKLAEKPPVEERRERRQAALARRTGRSFILGEVASLAGTSSFFMSPTTYDLMVGTRPDLYRAFMIRAWTNLGPAGVAGLVHPDTHLGGGHERRIRAAAYRRLRVHADFINVGNRFFPPPVGHTLHFGLHIYGNAREINFLHLSWIFDTTTLLGSLAGEVFDGLPGIKHKGSWDIRPHRSRVINVNRQILEQWRQLSGEADLAVDEMRLLYPVTSREHEVVATLGSFDRRLGELSLQNSRGYHEKNDKEAGIIRWQVADPADWSEVVLQGPHLGGATPFFKQAPDLDASGRPLDLRQLSENAVPRTGYQRATDLATYQRTQTRWVDPRDQSPRRYAEFYRVAWRQMIPSDTDRSLFAALIPPGATHVHTVYSMALHDNRATAMVAGFWTALPQDYLLRVAGMGHLTIPEVRAMPAPDAGHPLAAPLLLRTLRLNCLTRAYAALWEELHDDSWQAEQWAVNWNGLRHLGAVEVSWTRDTPLRTEVERRAAMVELDALVAVWLGLKAEDLVVLYKSRFPVLAGYEDETYFDAEGRKIAGHHYAYGHGQTKEHYHQLMAHLEHQENVPPPEGYTPPFYRALSKYGFDRNDRYERRCRSGEI